MVIGPSGSGKSTIWRLLRLALGKVGQTVKHYTMNPKAMPRTQVRVLLFWGRLLEDWLGLTIGEEVSKPIDFFGS